ncbi:hypothetical protein [Kurthia sp. Dielmo]|uniref:hypothetical protein n=1 Tax=Kurthia sp. Dielmo TaxID=1033738 RepID=UPI001647285C|nr:hypothetical protein [Kurthia sp. Dielmo]
MATIKLKNSKGQFVIGEYNENTKETLCPKKHVLSVNGGTYTCRSCNERYRKV